MPCYIEGLPTVLKAQRLVIKYGAQRILEPVDYEGVSPGKVVVCVLENVAFEAACVCYDAQELRECKYDGTKRAKTWLLMDREVVRSLVSVKYRFLV